jgi:cytochrome P450
MSADIAFNPIDPEFRRDPFGAYAHGREQRGGRHAALPLPLFSLFRYEDIQTVLRDHETFSNVLPRPDHVAKEIGENEAPSMLGSDPPRHDRLRGLVNSAFTPRIIQRLRPRMVEVANQLVDDAVRQGEVDLVEALSYPLPVVIIAEIIGVPTGDREQFKTWSDQIVANLGLGLLDGGDPERARKQQAVLSELRRYFIPLAEDRRKRPREDLLTGLVEARYEGSALNDDEMLQMLSLLLVAGNETTTTLIGNAAVELMAHPAAAQALRDDPSRIPRAVDEVLRFSAPIQFVPRWVARETQLCGERVEPGTVVLSWVASANRDERVFDRPDDFDIERSKNPYLSFGFGTHYCIGANLARLEAQVALEALLTRTRRFERSDDQLLPLHSSPVFRSFSSIPIRLEGSATA